MGPIFVFLCFYYLIKLKERKEREQMAFFSDNFAPLEETCEPNKDSDPESVPESVPE